MKKTTEQQIADYETKIALLKQKARKKRTRVLIVAGATLEIGFKKFDKPTQEKIKAVLKETASDSDKPIMAEYLDLLK